MTSPDSQHSRSSLFISMSNAFMALLLWGASAVSASQCRCFPGDVCWPPQQTWSDFNRTVDGRLIATIPLATPCHDPNYNGDICKTLQSDWTEPDIHFNSSSSIMAPFYTNNSCSPFTPKSTPCLLGTYIDYAVDVANPDHVARTIDFANKYNIRLVIRNTGHDYNGKSTGAGTIGIWTHHLKYITFTDYRRPHYTGKAIKMGAGVQGFEAYEAAHSKGFAVVGGECPTVGLAGGYTQGGGHSSLGSKFGLAADQALEWEVITGDGRFLTANREQNSDLYWALSGGGGGTYGVVWSLTSKAHPDFIAAGANLTFSSANISQDMYFEGIAAYHASLPKIVDRGATGISVFDQKSFMMSPLTGPNMTAAEMTTLLKPFTDQLDHLKIKYTMVVRDFPTYMDEFNNMMWPITVGEAQYGGWLIPRSVVENNNKGLTSAFRNIISGNAGIITVGIKVSKEVTGDVDNAVLPAWRDVLLDTVVTTPWNFTAPAEEMLANQMAMTNSYIPQLEALAPDSGCYMNEGDFRQPNWQKAFYGKNYNTLRQIKAKYDPYNMFYAITAVGSDEWTVGKDGRLCRA